MHFLAAKNDVPMTLACPVVGKQIVWNKSVQISSVTRFWISRQFFFEGALLLLCFRAPASEPPASCCVLWSGKNRQTYCSVENQLLDSDCSELHDSMIFYAAAVWHQRVNVLGQIEFARIHFFFSLSLSHTRIYAQYFGHFPPPLFPPCARHTKA